MDFKSLISKIESIDGKIEAVQAPVLDKAVQLNEDAQLRVLAGQTTYVAEAKKKAEQDKDKKEVKEENAFTAKKDDAMKVGDKKASSTGGTIEKTATGIKHHAGKNYGGSKSDADDADDDKPKKKAKKESVEPEFKSKFMKMVEAKKEEAADKKKKCPPMSHIKKMCQDGKSTAEICKMHPDCDQKELKQMVADCKKKLEEGAKPDFLDLDKDGDKKEPMKSAAGDKGDDSKDKDSDSKGLSAKQKKLPPGLQKAIAAKSESKMMPKGKKQAVKESVEPKLTFRDMVKLVQESGGQQQIDATDRSLFNWATRVAESKMGAGMKAELYAGLIYERNGGVFEMYDVLSEAEK